MILEKEIELILMDLINRLIMKPEIMLKEYSHQEKHSWTKLIKQEKQETSNK